MPWLQLETELKHRQPDELESQLEALGALAVWLTDAGDDPVLEPLPGSTPLWPSTRIAALFPADCDQEKILAGLTDFVARADIKLAEIQDANWIAEWEHSLVPLMFGDKLCVVRQPDELAPDGRLKIILTPGMAFGTGEHPTTAMCLTWLENLGPALQGKRLLDYGCGSGLLAIAGLKLGAGHATAVDIDSQALSATAHNAKLNVCSDRLAIRGPDEIDSGQHDVLVANILSDTLISCGPSLNMLTAPGAPIALSGVLTSQADRVCEAWANWAKLSTTDLTDDWVLLSGHKHEATTN